MDFSQYIRPELLILIPVLNLIGMFVKKSGLINGKYIPLALGGAGAVLGSAYTMLFPKNGCDLLQSALMGVLQGILCAGMAVYGHQMSKQMKKNQNGPAVPSDASAPSQPADAKEDSKKQKNLEA